MFSQQAISTALSIWLGAAAIGLVFSLLVGLVSSRQAHDGHGDGHGADQHDHGDDGPVHHEDSDVPDDASPVAAPQTGVGDVSG